MIILSAWVVEVRRDKSTVSRSIIHKWTVSLPTEVLHLWPYSSDKKHLHCHFVFYRQFSSLDFQQTVPISQIHLSQVVSSQENLCFQLWQDLFCTWKYKQLQRNGGIGPRSLSSAMPQSSHKCYSCIVSSCSNIVDVRQAELCRPTYPWMHSRKPQWSAKSEGENKRMSW